MSTILEHYSSSDLVSRTSIRAGEQRLGQVISAISPEHWANEDELPFKFVIVGVEEDFGVRANYGRGGAQESYQAFHPTSVIYRQIDFSLHRRWLCLAQWSQPVKYLMNKPIYCDLQPLQTIS